MSLSLKFRPKSLEQIVGQGKIVAVFKKFVAAGSIPHSIFFGAAGSGKTTMARVIASELNYDFYELDATSLKVEDIRKILSSHAGSLIKPLIFIDGNYTASTRDFHKLSLHLDPGLHTLTVVDDRGHTLSATIRVEAS